MEKTKNQRVRIWVQIFFFVLIGAIAINKTLAGSGLGIPFLSQASLHALCPFGGIVTLYNLATLGTFIQKIHASAVVLMVIVFALAILFGPVFCGWVCPLGSIQEWIGKLGRKWFKSRYNAVVPMALDNVLRYFRYVVLALVVVVTAKSGYLMFANVDPYNALFTFWSEEVATPALIILALTLGLSLMVERPWCRYACPYGALLGIFNKFRIFKIQRNASTCIHCGKCDRACPMGIDVSGATTVTHTSCITCLKCTSEDSCPIEDTVSLQLGQYTLQHQEEENR